MSSPLSQEQCPRCGYLFQPLETICPRCSKELAVDEGVPGEVRPEAGAAESAPAGMSLAMIKGQTDPALAATAIHVPAVDSPSPSCLLARTRAWAIAAFVWGLINTLFFAYGTAVFVLSGWLLSLAPLVLALFFVALYLTRGGVRVLQRLPGSCSGLRSRSALAAVVAFFFLLVFSMWAGASDLPRDRSGVIITGLVLVLEFAFPLGLCLTVVPDEPDRAQRS